MHAETDIGVRPRRSVPRDAVAAGVNLVGYASSPLGLGEDLRQAAHALLNAGCRVNILDVPTESSGTEGRSLSQCFSTKLVHDVTVFFASPFEFNRMIRGSEHLIDGRYLIGNFLWELEHFPPAWAWVLRKVDEVWVPTEFVARSFRQAGARNVRVNPTPAVPLALNRGDWRQALDLRDDEFVFGFMFDLHSTVGRKNPLAVVEAYRLATLMLPPQSRTTLLIKIHRANLATPDLAALERVCAERTDIRLIKETVPSARVVEFYETIDAYVSLHRTEGLGRTIIEAAQCGLPVVGTAYSGSGEVLRLADGIGVSHRLVPCLPGQYPNCVESVWAEPSVEHAALEMVRLVERGRSRRPVPERLNAHFSAAGYATRTLARLREIGTASHAMRQSSH